MSRMATAEYIGAKRRAYAEADSAKRRRLLDEVCETTGYSRKYANRLLTGNRKFRERKGRGKTYRGEVLGVLEKVWREAGCPCLPHFKAEVERWVEEYASEVARVPPDIREALVRMSASTMSRALAGSERVKPGWSKANKHSGRRVAGGEWCGVGKGSRRKSRLGQLERGKRAGTVGDSFLRGGLGVSGVAWGRAGG